MGVRGYAFHRKPGTRDGLKWALAQGGLMALAVLGLFSAASAIHPIVSPNPMLGRDAWVGLLAVCLVLGAISSVLWERNRRRQRTATILLIAVCLIIVGLFGLRAGGLGTMVGTPLLVVGVFGLVVASLQGAAALVEGTADYAP
jgi:peptidoglycan/LPS O-acetylase OafA/YrhL